MGRTVDADGTTSADDGVVWDGGWDVAQGVRGRWEEFEHVDVSNEGKTRRHGRAPETGCGAGTSLVALRMDPLAAHDPKHSRRCRVLVVAPYPTTNFSSCARCHAALSLRMPRSRPWLHLRGFVFTCAFPPPGPRPNLRRTQGRRSRYRTHGTEVSINGSVLSPRPIASLSNPSFDPLEPVSDPGSKGRPSGGWIGSVRSRTDVSQRSDT